MVQVLYRQKWDETKDKYLLPPDAPELVLAVKNAANYSKVGTVFFFSKNRALFVSIFKHTYMYLFTLTAL